MEPEESPEEKRVCARVREGGEGLGGLMEGGGSGWRDLKGSGGGQRWQSGGGDRVGDGGAGWGGGGKGGPRR